MLWRNVSAFSSHGAVSVGCVPPPSYRGGREGGGRGRGMAVSDTAVVVPSWGVATQFFFWFFFFGCLGSFFGCLGSFQVNPENNLRFLENN